MRDRGIGMSRGRGSVPRLAHRRITPRHTRRPRGPEQPSPSAPLAALAPLWDGRRLWFYAHNPQPVIEVVDVRQPIAGIEDDTPRHRLVLNLALHVGGAHERDLA